MAFFTDCFHEVNGVALTSQKLQDFAHRRGFDFFSVHAGPRTKIFHDGSVTVCELERSMASFAVESDLYVDPLLVRYRRYVRRALEKFQPELIHITSLSDFSILGALAARDLRIPFAAAWHTDLHKFASWRLKKGLKFLPGMWSELLANLTEDATLRLLQWYYGLGRVLFAPNEELIQMLQDATGRPVFLMQRGVDTELFSPAKRLRDDDVFELGFVGRVSAEKNVRFLARLEEALVDRGCTDFRITVVGDGGERRWLQAHLKRGNLPGVLRGEHLARAYANFDLFVFPSHTDTFGNVIQEALASGVPSVVTPGGGPKFLVDEGVTGFVAADDKAFVNAVLQVMDDPGLRQRMRTAARERALAASWDSVFERMFGHYDAAFPASDSKSEFVGARMRA